MAFTVWFLNGLLLLLLGLSTTLTLAMPPPPPIHCNATGCVLSNSYGAWGDRKECWVSTVAYPTTEEELRSVVARASRMKLKVKVVSGFSHTIQKLACPALSTDAVLISTSNYNSDIVVDIVGRTVTADSGVGLRDLIDRVEAAGLSLVAATYWEGVSVGGLLSTGAHGSSWWGQGGAVHDHVVSLNLVIPAGESDGYAKIIKLDRRDPLFDAARVSLGLLGVISKVTLSLEPGFKRSITYSFQDDACLEDNFMDHARRHEFADITWFPSQHKAVYRYDDRVPLATSGDGVNDYFFQSNPTSVPMGQRAAEKLFERSRNITGKCTMAAAGLEYKKSIANGLKNNVIFTGYPVVGRQGRMQTSGSCLHSPAADTLSMCPWDPRIKGLFFYETAPIFPATKFGDFIRDVKKLRDLKPENFCGMDVYTGFLIRFIKGSKAYLGQPEDSVAVDFNYYRADDPLTPRLDEDVWEEVEQMAHFKYGARPHWGKNRKVAFLGVQHKYPSMGKFVAAMKQLDRRGMFYNPWSEEILFGEQSSGMFYNPWSEEILFGEQSSSSSRKDDGCALEGQCICSEDRHCSPADGYFCKPGLVYQEARVCRYSISSTK